MRNRKPPVVILSGIRWDFLWQRHQILATRFAHAGYKTIFVETTGLATPRPDRSTLRKVLERIRLSGGKGKKAPDEPNLTVYSPLTAPPTWRTFRSLNRRIFAPRVARELLRIAGEAPIVVAYPPTRTTLDIISGLRPQLLYYDCSEDYGGFPGIPEDIAVTERELLLKADLVSCTAPTLLEKARTLRADAFLSGPGVNYEQFAVLQDERSNIEPRTVCYFGHVDRERIDFSAFQAVAEAGFKVRIVGEVAQAERRFLNRSGIECWGEVPHDELPAALDGVDVFLLPYLENRLTRSISPAKTYECLATGKPVAASPLPALKALGDHVYLARESAEFVEVLRGLKTLETKEKIRARVGLARENSWEARFEEIEKKLWDTLENR